MKTLLLISLFFLSACSTKNWQNASRQSANMAPKASEINEDIVLIYHARAFAWRGYFGVHPWITWKKKNETQYTVAQVMSWNLRNEGTTVNVKKDIPDRLWYDSTPTLLFEARGEKATKIIAKLPELIKNYPFQDRYVLWPGPNSNTFVSYLIRNIDELNIELPANAIGKDYFGPNTFVSKTASQTGYTLSAFGYIGITASAKEGVELNLLGLHFGVDFWSPAIKLPFVGRLGFDDKN